MGSRDNPLPLGGSQGRYHHLVAGGAGGGLWPPPQVVGLTAGVRPHNWDLVCRKGPRVTVQLGLGLAKQQGLDG